MLQIDNITSGYGPITILHGVSLRVEKSQIVCIIGPNGSGKSTIFKTIFGLLTVRTGRVVFQDTDVTNWKPNQVVRRGISYVPQTRSIFRTLTVEENLEMGAYIRRDVVAIRHDITRMYEMFPILRTRRNVPAALLSGGEQQMLVMSRALLLNPDLVLLDEPSLGLEPKFTAMIFERIQEINRHGQAIVMIEQNARRALEIADYAYVLDLGKVRFEGPAKDILRNNEVQRLYLGG